MKPASLPMRLPSRPACQLCGFIIQRPTGRRAFVSASSVKAPAVWRQPARSHVVAPRTTVRRFTTTRRQLQTPEHGQDSNGDAPSLSDRIAALKESLAEVETLIQSIYDSPKVQAEGALMQVLDGLVEIAQRAISIRSQQPLRPRPFIRQSSAGAILSGLDDEKPSPGKKKAPSFGLDALPSPSYLSKVAQDFIKHEKVFLSEDVLGLYIHLQRILGCPRTIPEALYLYAHKPVPEEGSSPPKFSNPSPQAAKQVIPADLADDALTAAIDAKDMVLALSVVEHTYCTPAWRRHRMISKLGLPSVLAAMTPLALYMIAQEMSVYSNFIDPRTFKLYAFAGLSTYVMCTGTLGFVALTTWNDHHDRVVWRPGTPLLDRYIREDERAALDRIACAWGFKEDWKRGDEDGDEWEGLRQWIAVRGMVLDKSDLMPGMNPGR
ncbi:hypothetical protein ACEQ8H_007418 [Pleosporales sp. CAS-2024a]